MMTFKLENQNLQERLIIICGRQLSREVEKNRGRKSTAGQRGHNYEGRRVLTTDGGLRLRVRERETENQEIENERTKQGVKREIES